MRPRTSQPAQRPVCGGNKIASCLPPPLHVCLLPVAAWAAAAVAVVVAATAMHSVLRAAVVHTDCNGGMPASFGRPQPAQPSSLQPLPPWTHGHAYPHQPPPSYPTPGHHPPTHPHFLHPCRRLHHAGGGRSHPVTGHLCRLPLAGTAARSSGSSGAAACGPGVSAPQAPVPTGQVCERSTECIQMDIDSHTESVLLFRCLRFHAGLMPSTGHVGQLGACLLHAWHVVRRMLLPPLLLCACQIRSRCAPAAPATRLQPKRPLSRLWA